MDWSGAGRQSALRGERLETVKERFRDCFQANEAAAWNERLVQGYQLGLTHFCSKENAARFAQSGGEYKGTCAPSTESEFQSGYAKSRMEFLEIEVKRLRSEVSSLEAEVGSLRGQLLSCQAM